MNRNELSAKVNQLYKDKFIHTHHATIDIAGDLVAGILLDRILWWFTAKPNGESKVKVKKDGFIWLAKKRTDWVDEIRISPKQYDRASKLLVDAGLIIVGKYKFNGDPMIHIRPNYDVYMQRLNEWKRGIAQQLLEGVNSELTDGEKPTDATDSDAFLDDFYGNDEMDIPEMDNSLFTDGGFGFLPLGKNGIDQRGNSLTGNTTGNTTEKKKERKKEAAKGDEPFSQETKKSTKKEPNARKASSSNNIRSYEVIITDYTTNSDLVQALWDFIAMRKMKKNPPTDRALRTVLNKLDELSNNDDTMKIKLLDNAIERGWLTVYPLKQEGGNNSGINGRNHAENSIPAWAKDSFI